MIYKKDVETRLFLLVVYVQFVMRNCGASIRRGDPLWSPRKSMCIAFMTCHDDQP